MKMLKEKEFELMGEERFKLEVALDEELIKMKEDEIKIL